MIGYLVAGTVVVVIGAGIVRNRRKRRAAEEEQRAEEQRRVDAGIKQHRELAEQREMKERDEIAKRQAKAKAEEEQRAVAAEKRAALVARFKELFGKTFVEANLGWHRKVLEAEVDSMLHATAYALHDAFEHEQECENSDDVEKSAMLAAKTVSAQLKKRFWDLFKVARDLELPVRWHFAIYGGQSKADSVLVLPMTVKEQMIANCRGSWSSASKIIATYRAYVSPVNEGFFTGNVSFCNVEVANSVGDKYAESVDAMTVGAK